VAATTSYAQTLTAGATTAASTTVTVASTTGLVVGAAISGSGIPAGATIVTIGTGTMTISAAATATTTAQVFTVAQNINMGESNTGTGWTTQTINSLRNVATTTSGTTLTIAAANTITIATGGILYGSAVGANSSITGGTIVPGLGKELVVFVNGNKSLTINSVLGESAAGITDVTFRGNIGIGAGANDLVLGANNTYTGNTYISGLRIRTSSASVTAPFGTGLNGNVYIYGNNGGQFLTADNVTLAARNWYIIGAGWEEGAGQPGAFHGAIRLGANTTLAGTLNLMGDASVRATGAFATVSAKLFGNYDLTARSGWGDGTINFTGDNTGWAGSYTIGSGGYRFDTVANLGSPTVIQLGNYGSIIPGFAGIQAAVIDKVGYGSFGTIALRVATQNEPLDFRSANAAGLVLGANENLTYNGAFFPNVQNGQQLYRLGGGGATLTFANSITGNAALVLTGASANNSYGTVTLNPAVAGGNTYVGGTIVGQNGPFGAVEVAAIANPWSVFGNGPITFVSANPTFRLAAAIPSFATDPLAADMSSAANLTAIIINGGLKFNLNRAADTDMVVFARGIGAYGPSGSFVREGRGILRLDGINTYLGNTDNNGPGTTLVGTLLLNNANPFNAGYGINGAAAGNVLYWNNALGNVTQLNRDVTVSTIQAPNVTGAVPAGSILNLAGNNLTIAGTASTEFAGFIWGGVGAVGTGGLIKAGSGTLTLSSNNNANYTGKTTVLGGTLSLNFNNLTTAPTTIISSLSQLELGGGTLNIIGKTTTTNTQTFNNTTLLAGGSRTTRTLNTATALNFNFGTITRNPGAGLDFVVLSLGTGGVSVNNVNDASGLMGGWATVEAGANFAAITAGKVGAYAAYSATYAAGANVENGILATIGGAPISINSLRFNAANTVTLDATAGLTVASGGVLMTPTVGANSVTIQGGTITSGNGTDLILHQWNSNAAAYLAVASKITGNIGLTKVGYGTVILKNGANDFTGTVNVGGTGGIFRVEATGALGASTNVVNLISTGQFQIDQDVTIANPINIKFATGVVGQGAIFLSASSGVGTLSGPIFVQNTTFAGGLFASNGARLDITGPVTAAPGQMVTTRAGNVRFSNDPAVSGTPSDYDYFYNQNAVVTLGANNALSTRAIVDIGSVSTASFDLNGYNQTIGALTRVAAQTATVTNTSGALSTLTINVAANNGGILTGDWSYAGQLIGNLALVKSGAGIQLISGVNSFTGGTTITAGTLRIGNANALGGDTGFNGLLTINGGTLDIFGTGNAAIGALAGSGGVITDTGFQLGSSVLSTYSVASSAYAGSINDGNFRTLSLYKDGTGILALTGASTYSGVTKIFEGALSIGNNTALGTSVGETIVSSGAAVQVTGGITSAEAFTVSGTGLSATSGVLQNLSGDNTLSGAITVTTASRFGSDAGTLTLGGALTATNLELAFGGAGNVVVSGAMSLGTAGVTKDGLGTLTLSGTNTYAGATAVTAGALRIANAAALGTTSSLVVTAGAALQIAGGVTYVGVAATTPILQNISGNNVWSVALRPTNGGALTLRSDAGVLTLNGVAGSLNAQSADSVNRALVLTGAGDGSLATNFVNAVSLTKSGAGVWSFDSAQTYAIETAINGGTIKAGANGYLSANSVVRFANVAGAQLDLNGTTQSVATLEGAGATGGAVLLGLNGELTVGANSAFGGSVDGSGISKLIKSGTGSFTMGPTSALTGTVAVNVNNGTLSFGGNAGANITANVASGAILGGSGTFLGTVNVANGGTVQAGNGVSGSLAITNLVLGTISGNLSTLQFRNIDLGASASVMNIGTLTANGGVGSVSITAVNGGALANGTYDLANFANAVTDFTVFTVGSISGLGGRQSGTLVTSNANKLSVLVAGDSVRWHGAVGVTPDTAWHIPGGALNLRLVPGGGDTDYRANDAIIFNDLAASGTVVISEGNVSPSSLTIDNSAVTYAFSGAFGITGATGIVKNGAGAASFANVGNAFTGGVTLNAGTLTFTSSQNIAGGITVNGGNLVLGAANTVTGNVVINGSGTIVQNATDGIGRGTLAFGSGSTGSFSLNDNDAQLNGISTHATVGSPIIFNGAVGNSGLTVTVASGTDTFGGSIIDGGVGQLYFFKSGAGTLRLTGASTNFATLVSDGMLEIGQGGSVGQVGVFGGVLSFNRPDSFTRSAVTYGSGAVTILGGGNMTLTGSFGHDGGTNVAAGQILTLGNGGSIGGAGVLTVDGSLKVNNTGSASIGAVIGGLGSLSVDAGALVLTGSNVYQGATTVASGATLQVGTGGTIGFLPPSAVVTNNGTLVISRSGSLTFANSVNGSGDFVSRMAAGGTLTLSGNNAYSGITRIENGTLVIASASAWANSSSVVLGSVGATATLELNGQSKSLASLSTAGTAANQTVRNSAVGTATLTFTSAGTVTFDGAFAETAANTKIAIGYAGGGILDFGTTNVYTGGTVISSGTARLGADNAFSVGALTLGGSGTVGILDLGGFNQSVSAFSTGVGAVAVSQLIGNSSTTADSVFTYAGGSTTFGATIQDSINGGTRKVGFALPSAATVIIGGANTYTGTTTIAGSATVQIGNFDATSASLGVGPIVNSGTLIFARATNAYVLPATNIVSGIGAITLASTGAVTSSAAGQFNSSGLLTFGNVAGSTVMSSLDLTNGGATFGGLLLRNRSAVADNLITVGVGQTFRVNGAVTVGYNSGATTETRLKLTGGGAFLIGSVGNSALINVQLGGNSTTNVTNRAVVDMSGLGSFYAGLAGGLFRVGDATNANGGNGGGAGSLLILAPTSTIVAASFLMDSPTSDITHTVRLGTGVNTFNVNTLTIGGERSGALVNFYDGSLGSLVVRARAGTGRTAINVGYSNATTGAVPTSTADFTGHTIDILASTLAIGGRTGADGASFTAAVSMSAGTLDATSVILADRRNTTAAGLTGTTTGTLNVSGGTFIVGNTGLSVAVNTSNQPTNATVGTINISGGTVTFNGPVTLGGSTTTGNNSSASLLITGGTVDVRNSIAKGIGNGFASVTSTIQLNNATLDLNGFTIGTLTRPINNMLLESGTLKNVTEINGGGAFSKTTAGTLILEGNNGFSGQFTIAAGTLQVGTGSTTGTLGSGPMVNNASLIINRAGTYAAANAISGTGTLTLSGTGTVFLTGASSYDGLTTVSSGLLAIGHATALGSALGATTIANGAALELRGGIAVAGEALAVTGTGIGSTGALRSLSGVNSFGGTVTLGGDTLIQSDAGTFTLGNATAIVAGTNIVTFDGAGNLVVSGAITGTTASLVKNGAGQLTLSGANTFDGAIAVNVGTLRISNAGALGTAVGATTISSGAALELFGFASIAAEGLSVTGTGVGGTGALRNLSGNNSFNGLVTLAGPTLIQSDAGSLFLAGATSVVAGANALTVGGAGNVAISGIIDGVGASLTKVGAGTLSLSGVNTFDGGTTVTAGTLSLAASGVLNDSSSLTVNGGTFNVATFNETINQVILSSGTIAGSTGALTSTQPFDLRMGTVSAILAGVNVVKTTTGLVTLSGANSFTGQLQVNAGTVAFTGSANLGAGTVSIDGGTLAYIGTGTQAVPVGITASQAVAFGTSGVTLNVANRFASLNLSGAVGATSSANLTKTGLGKVAITGSVNLGSGTATVSQGTLGAGFTVGGVSAITVANGATLNLFDASAVTLGATVLGLSSGSALGFDLGAPGTNDSILLGVGSALGGTVTLNLNNLGGVAAGTYTLLTATSGLDLTTWILGTAPVGLNYKFDATGGTSLILTASPVINRYFNGVTGASWSTLASWSNDAAGTVPSTVLPGLTETLNFSTVNAVGPVIATTLDAAFTIDSLIFSSTPTGVTSFTVAAGTGGTLAIYPGSSNNGIEVQANAGAILISAPLTATGVQAWTVDGTGLNGSSLTLSGGVTYTAPVTKAGAGTVTLSGAGTGAGGLNIALGTVNIGTASAFGTGPLKFGSGITINNTSGGVLANTGVNTLEWNSGFTFTGTNSYDLGAGAVSLREDVAVTVTANGFTVGGAISDAGSGFTLTKLGGGILTLNGVNTFGGAGKTVAIQDGRLNVNSDAALGDLANSVTISANGSTWATGLGVTGTFTTARTINLNAASNSLSVLGGNTLTVSNPFAFSALTNALTKNGSGNLILSSANSGWTGGLTINSGVVRLNNALSAGTGPISISPTNNAIGTALQIAGGFELTNAITLQGNAAQLQGGINFGGQLQSVSGVNTLSGLLTLPYGAVISADVGSTLKIYGGVQNTVANNILRLVANGTIVFGTTELSFVAPSTGLSQVEKFGTGTLRIESANLSPSMDAAGAGLVVRDGTVVVDANGSWRSAVYLDVGSTLRLDNSVVNFATGRMSSSSTGTYKNITFRGGNLDFIGSQFSGLPTVENFWDVSFGKGLTTISLLQQNFAFTQTTLWFRGGQWANQAPAAGGSSASFLFRGVGLAPSSGRASVQFASAPLVAGEGGAIASKNRGILPWALVDLNYSGPFTTNLSFVTPGAIGNNVRPLDPGEYEIDPTVFGGTAQNVATNSNVLLTALSGGSLAMTANTQRNSLTIEGNAGLALADGVQFNLRSGGILVRPGSTSTISGGVLNQVSSLSGFNIWTVGDLTISSSLAGGNGIGNGAPSLVKAGAGTLTIAPVASTINGLGAIGTNTMSGLLAINEGTVKFGATNAIQANNYFSAIGGTLDLNGKSQLFWGVFTESTITNRGTLITSNNGHGHFLVNADNTARQLAARVTGDVSFTRSGQNTLNLWGASDYTGETLINGGLTVMYGDAAFSGTSALNISYANLYLDNKNSLVDNTNRINDNAVVNLRQGYLEFRGREQAFSFENLGTVNLVGGNSFLYSVIGGSGDNTATLRLGNLVRNVGGGTVNFSTGTTNQVVITQLNGVAATAASVLTNGTLGGWAVHGTNGSGASHFASYSDTLGVGALGSAGFPAYDNATSDATTLVAPAATANININTAGANIPVANDLTINSLRFGDQTTMQVNIATGKTLTVTSGGILFAGTGTNSHYMSGGSVTTPNPELFLYSAGGGWQVFRSAIVGSGLKFVKSGNGPIFMETGIHTYDGGTLVNQGWLGVNASSRIPLATDVTKGLIINGGQVETYGAGIIAAGNEVTLNGPAQLRYFGDNTVAKLTINNDGSTSTAVIRTFAANQGNGNGARGILTIGAGGLYATSSNVTTTSYIEGRVDFGATANFVNVAPNAAGGFSDVNPLLATLALQGVVGSAGGITKTGNGVLQFSAQNAFTSAFTVAAGGIKSGVVNAGSRFSTLVLDSLARFDLNGLNTTWGGLSGTGDIFSATGTPTLNVGFNNADTIFSGRFMRFNDAAYGLISKVGSGKLTLDTAQTTGGSFGAISVNGGTLAYTGAGKAFVSTASANSIFNVNTGGLLQLDNSVTNLSNRLGTTAGGTVNMQGGRLLIGGSAAGATTEGIANLSALNGGGRIELAANAAQGMSLNVTTLTFANASLNASTTITSTRVTVPSTVGLIPGMLITGDGIAANTTIASILDGTTLFLSANATATGVATLNAVQTNGSLVIAGLSDVSGNGLANLAITNAGFSAGQGTGVNGWNNKAVRGDILGDASVSGLGTGFLTKDSFTNNWRALASDEQIDLSVAVTGMQNAKLSAATTLNAPTTVNTLTTSGTASISSGLAASVFGKYGPSGDLLSLTLANAAGLLVKDGTTTFNMGTLVGPSTGSAYFHVLPGATLVVNASLTPAATGGFVLDNGGTMELGATTGFFTGTVAINNGTLRLNSGQDNTLAVSASAGAMGLPFVALNGLNAVLDLGTKNQTVRGLSSSNQLPGMGGTVTGQAGAFLTTTDNSTFAGKISGGLNFVRSGNSTTTLTSASDYTGATVVRGGTLQLIDGGSLASTAGLRLAQGTLTWNNYGLNAVDSPVRLNAANAVTLAGGTFTVIGGGSVDNIVNLDLVTAELGSVQINTNPYISMGATNQITIGDFVLGSTGVRPSVNFNGWTTLNSGGTNTLGSPGLTASSILKLTKINGTAFTAASMTNNLIGGWAVADGSTFATYSDIFGISQMGVNYYGYASPGFTGTDISAATSATGNYNDGTSRTLSGPKAAYSWRFSPGAAQTITLNSANVTLGVGIVTNANQTIILQAADSTSSLTAAGSDLYVYTNQGTMNFNVKLTGNMNLIKTGGAALGLGTPTAPTSNDYSGTTYVNAGTLNLNASSGFRVIPGNLVISGLASATNSTVTMVTNEGQINPTSSVSLIGGGTLNLTGNNTLASLTFLNEGAMSNPLVAGGAKLILTEVNAITATNQSPVTVPNISAPLEFSAPAVITVNAGLAATGLTITSVITQNIGMSTFTKAGSGVLALSGQSTFATDFTLAGGALMFGANSTPLTGTVTSGPIGRGTLQILGGTSLLSDGTVRTIANAVNVQGDFAFGGRGAGAGVSLAGKVNLGAAMRTISVTNYGVTASFNGGLMTGLLDQSTALTKTGNGVLVLGTPSTQADLNGAGVKVSGGVIRWANNDSLPATSLLTADVASGFDLAGFNQTTNQITGTGFFTNSSTVNPSMLTVGGDNSTFTFSGALTDNVAGGGQSLGLTKTGSGKLMYGAVNNYLGLTDIKQGSIEITNIGSFGLGMVNIDAGAELTMNRSGSLNFPNELTGGGIVRTIGSGTTILTAPNGAFTGRFYIDNGILQVGDGTVAGDIGDLGSANQVHVRNINGNTGQLHFNYFDSLGYDLYRPIWGNGDLVQQGIYALRLAGSNPNFTGRAIVNRGSMEAYAVGSLNQATGIIVQNGATFKVTGNDAVGDNFLQYGVPLTLNGGTADALVQTAFLGAITLNGGTLTSDTVTQLDTIVPYTKVASWVFLGDVSATADSTISAEFVDFGILNATRDFNVAADKKLTFSGSFGDSDLAGVASISKSGAGTFELSGSTKTFTGTTTLKGGFLKFADQVTQLGTSSATVHANLVFAGGSAEYTGGAFSRKFLVKDGGAGFHATSGLNPLLVNGADQIDFDNATPATATSRPLTLSGTSILENTFTAGPLDNTEAARAFSSVVKNGVGQWIVGGTGNTLDPNVEVNVNGGVLGFYLNSLGTTASTGKVNLANGSTLRWESTNNQDLGARLKVADGATATVKFDNTTTATTFNGGMTFGTGALVKSGAGDLVLATANTFSGGLTVSQGKVTVSDAGALGSGAATVSNTGTLVINNAVTNNINVTGSGTIGGTLVAPVALGSVTVGDYGTVSRGTAIGNFSTTNMTLSGGARLEFKIWDINTKGAGVGYDQYLFGNLDLSGASVSNKVVIKLISLTDGTNLGAAGNLSLLQGIAGIQNFSFGSFNQNTLNLGTNTNVNDLFTFDTSQFTYTGGTASHASLWSIDFNTANGAITLTAVPEPSTYGIGLGALALAAAAIRRRRRQEKKA
jgi:autotransporter-associated beta strand protein